MNDLIAFLRVQLDEEAELARVAGHGGQGIWWQDDPDRFPGRIEHDGNDAMPVVYDEGAPSAEQAAHIARHDPARVLAEVEAKRRIVECHEPWIAGNGDTICGRCGRERVDGRPGGHFPCTTLRLLASPYADHQDYRDEWRP